MNIQGYLKEVFMVIENFIILFTVLCEILWNTSSGLKTPESTSLEYSGDDPSTQQLFG